MLRSLKSLFGFGIQAQDGEIGTVHDFYFENEDWMVRWLVASTGPWILGRKVLINLLALGTPDWEARKFPVQLSREQVKNSPDIDTERPMSRKEEISLNRHYGWADYRVAPGNAEISQVGRQEPLFTGEEAGATLPQDTGPAVPAEDWGDPELQSARAVIGYKVRATDGEVGQVEDLLAEENWHVRYLVVDGGSWLLDKKLIFSPDWVAEVHNPEKELVLDLSLEQIRTSPPYDPQSPLDQQLEESLYEHYQRTGI